MASDDSEERRVEDVPDEESGDDSSDDAERRADAVVEEVDGRIVDLLAWILDTETRAKIYVYLLANPGSTSEEVARGTGLYPSTVREALAELHGEEKVSREKRASEGAGNNPFEYTAIQPSELVGGVVDQVQRELNTIFTLDRVLDRGAEDELDDDDVEPVTITVEEVELDEESTEGDVALPGGATEDEIDVSGGSSDDSIDRIDDEDEF